MHINSLYSIQKITTSNVSIEALIELNETNAIFGGHFPNQPVLPGACMLQILKEISEASIGKKLQLKKAGEIKFLSMVKPSVNKELQVSVHYKLLENSTLHITAKIASGKEDCCKVKGEFIVAV